MVNCAEVNPEVRDGYAFLTRLGRADDESGSVAVEFALIAPILLVSLIAMVNIATGIYDRMAMDHMLRVGAHFAMRGVDEAEVMNAMVAVADQTFATTAERATLSIAPITETCACPEQFSTAVACNTICAGGVAPSAYLSLGATKSHSIVGVSLQLSAELRVQVR